MSEAPWINVSHISLSSDRPTLAMDMQLIRKRRSKKWRVIFWLYVGINALGGVWALGRGEGTHAALHIALLMPILATYFIRLITSAVQDQPAPIVQPTDDVLDRIERSVDGIALNLERIGEAQRFSAKVLADRGQIKQ